MFKIVAEPSDFVWRWVRLCGEKKEVRSEGFVVVFYIWNGVHYIEDAYEED